ncbi:hypothetical protein SDC9_142542 [bioreactor metagenome]|uniref:Uncharacterized protein n=1 Tax=bioreactor metagenome TaxID=1076179 RepID=A0A645E1W3_9ZZZZ
MNEQGYTYLEVYINSLVEHIVASQDSGTIISNVKNPLEEAKVQISYQSVTQQFILTAEQNISNLKVFDVSGRLLVNEKPADNQYKLNLNRFNSAVFMIQVLLDDGSKINRKLVK